MNEADVSNAVLLQKLDELFRISERVEKKTDAMDYKITALDERLRQVEKNDLSSSTINQSKIDAAHRRMDEYEQRIGKLEDFKELVVADIAEIKTRMGILVAVGMAIFASVVMIVANILTHGGTIFK